MEPNQIQKLLRRKETTKKQKQKQKKTTHRVGKIFANRQGPNLQNI